MHISDIVVPVGTKSAILGFAGMVIITLLVWEPFAAGQTSGSDWAPALQEAVTTQCIRELWGKPPMGASAPDSYAPKDKIPNGMDRWNKRPDPRSSLTVKLEHMAYVLYGEQFVLERGKLSRESLLKKIVRELYGNDWRKVLADRGFKDS
ncbi:MAG TPA: hypothetical protein PK093_09035 [Phycisphaerae bacterium]|nr:hypothetical protein [Phycisphaerae bacterium]